MCSLSFRGAFASVYVYVYVYDPGGCALGVPVVRSPLCMYAYVYVHLPLVRSPAGVYVYVGGPLVRSPLSVADVRLMCG